MNYLELRKEFTVSELRMNKKELKSNYLWFAFSISVFLFNVFSLFYSHFYWIAAISTGAMFVCTIMSYLFIWETRNNIIFNKEMLNRYEEAKDNELKDGELQQLKRTVEYYNDYFRTNHPRNVANNLVNAVCRENKTPGSGSPTAES